MPARGADEPACPSSTDHAYAPTAAALTGPADTELTIRIAAAPGCAGATAVKHLQVKTFDENDGLVDVVNLKGVLAPQGIATVTLDRVARGRRIAAEALVQTGTPSRTYVLDDSATSRLRPDLVVASVQAPMQTLPTRPSTS